MYIKSVEVTNYRIFYKNHFFNFNINQNKFLNIIFGKNSTGKSSLIEAIHWCLYGQEIQKRSMEPICNDKIIDEAAFNEEILVKVIVKFVNNFGDEIIVQRSTYFYKNKEGKLIHGMDNIFEISNDLAQFIPPEIFIQKNCCIELFDLLFIGENEIVFNTDFKNKINSILGNYFQFDVIDKMSIHLNNSYNKFLREYKKINYESSIIKEYNDRIEEKEKISQEIDNTNKELSELKELQEKHYNNNNSKNIERRQNLLKNLDNLERNKDNHEREYNSLVLKSFPMAILFNDVCSESNGLKLLHDFLSKENFEPSFYQYKYDLKQDLSNLKNEILDIPDYIRRIRTFYNEYHEIFNELKVIENSLSNEENDVFNEMDSIKKTIDFLIYKHKSLKRKKKTIEDEIRYLDNKIKEMQSISIEFRKKDAFYKEARDTIKFMKEEFFKNVLSNISDVMNTIFIHDFCMSDKFSNISLHENFEFDIVKNCGKHIHFSDLSYSEKYIFYLSFMFSIQRIIEEDIFLIIDTQFLNFDEMKWSNFLALLRCNHNQCFLLFNETKYDEVTRSNLIDNVNSEYELIN